MCPPPPGIDGSAGAARARRRVAPGRRTDDLLRPRMGAGREMDWRLERTDSRRRLSASQFERLDKRLEPRGFASIPLRKDPREVCPILLLLRRARRDQADAHFRRRLGAADPGAFFQVGQLPAQPEVVAGAIQHDDAVTGPQRVFVGLARLALVAVEEWRD